jgi:type IV pilus assembly protein PilF
VRPRGQRLLIKLTIGFVVFALLVSCAALKDEELQKEESTSIYLQLGVRYMELGKLQIAKENLDIALKKAPDDSSVHNALAFLYEKLGNEPQASMHYKKALALAPDDWSVQNNFGRLMCQQRDFKQGMRLLSQASSTPLNEKQWLALTNAGLCQQAMNNNSQAKAYFEQALILNKLYAPALVAMQKMSFQEGDYLAAQTYLQRYLEGSVYTSSVLWVAIQTELALNHPDLVKQYQQLLVEKFPLSTEAKQIESVLH